MTRTLSTKVRLLIVAGALALALTGSASLSVSDAQAMRCFKTESGSYVCTAP